MKIYENHSSHQKTHFDSVYINPGFENILQALEEMENRQKLLLIFEKDLERNDQFIFTRTFPYSFFEIPSLVNEFKILRLAMKLAPHLFQPQKVLYVSKNQTTKLTALAADYFYKNTYQKKLEMLKNKQLEQLAILDQNYRKGIYFQEYKYNVSRLFIELLKYFQKKGGSVKVKFPVKIEKNRVILIETKETVTAGKITVPENKKNTIYHLSIETPPNFSMVYKNSSLAFRFMQNKNGLQAEPLIKTSEKTTKLNLSILAKSLFQSDIKEIKTIEKMENPSLKKLIEQIKHPLSCTFEKTDLKDMHERCLEKFDLAKQTEISYNQFKTIFHRYGTGIDEITEDVYSVMNEFRDPIKIWKRAEKNYQKKYEWGN